MKKLTIAEALKSWHNLNEALRGCTEKFASDLLVAEMKGQRRHFIMLRIHKRITKLRTLRERKSLAKRIAPRRSRLRD